MLEYAFLAPMLRDKPRVKKKPARRRKSIKPRVKIVYAADARAPKPAIMAPLVAVTVAAEDEPNWRYPRTKLMAVYRLICADTGHAYIGSSIDALSRCNGHFSNLRRGAHHSPMLQEAFDMHGEASITFDVLEIVDDLLWLRIREQFWMWRYEGRLLNGRDTAQSTPQALRANTLKACSVDELLAELAKRGNYTHDMIDPVQ